MTRSRIFTLKDQLEFSDLTGDCNPIHIDPVKARRTQAGAPVVHGIHALLWLLDSIAADHANLPLVAAIKVRFARMIYVGDQVEAVVVRRDSSSLRAEIKINDLTALHLTLTFGTAGSKPTGTLSNGNTIEPSTKPHDWQLEDMADYSGVLGFPSTLEKMEQIFPHAAHLLSARRLTTLGCSTLLIGMIVPGLHSLYAGLTLTCCEDEEPAQSMAFKVTRVDFRFRLLRIDICGGGLSGTLETFVRQPPVEQAEFQTVSGLVSPGEFSGVNALIVGGSRGLGELNAKIIAAGGGNVTITYAVGKAEAEAVVAEITNQGGCCRAIPFDIHKAAGPQLAALTPAPTHLYYYATPAIFRGNPHTFSHTLLEDFNRFYVSGFQQIVEMCLNSYPKDMRVFYPSSVAVDECPPGMQEYAMSKRAGENLCAALNKQHPEIKITVARLPRLLTDQTATLQEVKTQNALDFLLPLIRDFHQSTSGKNISYVSL